VRESSQSLRRIAALVLYNVTMLRLSALACLLVVLPGCDVVGTTAATAAGASAEMQQAKQAKQIEDQVKQQVQVDVQQHSQQIDQTEKDAQ
jgi:uncharacterized membrane protein